MHAKDNGRIRYKRVCEVCGEVVEYRDIAKSYDSEDGQTVIITDEDIATLPEERSREIEVVEFVPAEQIDPLMYDKSYFLEPDSKSSKAYVLLAETLAKTERVAIVHFALRSKTRLAALRVKDFGKREVMIIHTLLWPDEIRDPDFPELDKKVEVKASRTEDGGPGRRVDDRRLPPRGLHRRLPRRDDGVDPGKIDGGEAFAVEEQPASDLDETDDVSDLLAKLEASVKARQEAPAKKAPAKKAAAKKAPAKKAATKK